ncbi:MAG: glycosyltransferase family 2 protein [Actinobacteria bacterium]|nr:glycosyltransferase family 2 protein [Actinomycetota bacterium]
MDAPLPRVLAILVAHDGAAWLEASLTALLAQDHPDLEVLAVDNGSTDGSRAILLEHLDEEDVLVAERDLGFGAAVSMALDASRAGEAEHVLFLHDDCVLAPDAVSQLAFHLAADDRLAVVGAKLVDWDDPRRLQSVGWSVDLTGRADSGLEADELDQGQRDQVHRALYVSTAAMLVRRSAFEELGRFDRRYHLFRDDLDLCWRAWLAGWDVEVVPAAVGRHQASASNYQRLGQTAFLGPRYFAERNTLATLLKNYGLLRLLVVLPLFLVVGVAKILGFIATRRLSDAWQTLRAWAWNVVHLRETRRLRAAVQASRQRSDGELRDLFAKVAPRLRAYGEAVGEWVAGSDLELDRPTEGPTDEPQTATHRLVAYVRSHPVSTAALVLGALGLVIALPLLGGGQLRGGELAPWPASPRAFLDDYVSSWHDVGGIGTSRSPSPAQAVLAVVHVLAFGSSWLAPRLLLLGALPLAWIVALRAGAFVTEKRVPRVAAATAYVLSPPALTALITGRIGTLVVVVALPGLLAAYATAMRADAAPDDAWRATAAAAIVAAVAIAFEPPFLLAFLAWLVVALGLAAGLGPSRRVRKKVVVRVLATGVGTFLLLFPWSVSLFAGDSPVLGGVSPVGADAQPFTQWLLMAPELLGVPGVVAGVGFLLAGLLGVVFGFSRRPLAVTALWAVALLGIFAAWGLGRAGEDAWAWPGLPLVFVAGALSGLLVIAMATAGPQLAAHSFGWRQVAAGTTTFAITAGLAVSAASLLDDPWSAFVVGEPALPAFIAVEEPEAGDFRVLVLADEDGVVEWDVTGPGGPTMASYGVPVPRRFVDAVRSDIEDVVSGADPGAAGRLGLFNIRYVVVPEAGRSDELGQVLGDQLDLEPQPVAEGQVLRVTGWLPRATFLPDEAVDTVVRRGEVSRGSQEVALEREGGAARFVGDTDVPGSVLVSEIATTAWEAHADGRRLELATQDGLLRFDVAEPADRIVVEHAHQGRRSVLVAVQLFVFLIALSLMLRPPRFAQESRR